MTQSRKVAGQRSGFALLTVLLVLLAVVTLTGVLYSVTILTQRRVRLVASGTNAHYAAEAGLKAIQYAMLERAQRGWLTTADTTLIREATITPEIDGIVFDTLSLELTFKDSLGTYTELSNLNSPVRGMRVWQETAILRAVARDTVQGAYVSLRQDITFDLTPFSQAALTSLGETEIVDGIRSRVRIVGAPDLPGGPAPAIRSYGHLWIAPDAGVEHAYDPSSPWSVEIFGSVGVQGDLYRTRKDQLLFGNIPHGTVGMYSNAVGVEALSGTILGEGVVPPPVDTTWLSNTFQNPGYQWVRGGTYVPTAVVFPPCTESETGGGVLNLRCRSRAVTGALGPNNETVVDVSRLSADSIGPSGVVYLLPAAEALLGYIKLENAHGLSANMTFASSLPIMISGHFNTTVPRRSAAIIAPRIFLDTLPGVAGGTASDLPLATNQIVINGLLVSGYTPSSLEGSVTGTLGYPCATPAGANPNFCGGVTSSIPTLVSSTVWWDGQEIVINGGVLSFPQLASYWTGGTYRDPSRTINYDSSLMRSPNTWPPGIPGRYTMTMGKIEVVPR